MFIYGFIKIINNLWKCFVFFIRFLFKYMWVYVIFLGFLFLIMDGLDVFVFVVWCFLSIRKCCLLFNCLMVWNVFDLDRLNF